MLSSDNAAATLKIRGVRSGLKRQKSRKGCVDTMGVERDDRREPRSDIICLEGNGYRPSHKGDGWIVGGQCTRSMKESKGYALTSFGMYAETLGTLRASGGDRGGAAKS